MGSPLRSAERCSSTFHRQRARALLLPPASPRAPSGYVGGSLSDTLRPLYGPTRFRVTAGNWHVPVRVLDRVNCGRAWADATVVFIRGAAPSVDSVTTSVEAACLPAGWGGAGLFVRYYRGQDYYNAAFLQNIDRLQFGVTFLQGRFLAFPRTPGQ